MLCPLSYTAKHLEARGGVEPRAFSARLFQVRFRRPTPGTRALELINRRPNALEAMVRFAPLTRRSRDSASASWSYIACEYVVGA
jgi:hypothetical protein